MNTVLLAIHIIFALITIAASFFAVYKAGSPVAAKAVKRTWQSFMATTVSGVGLVVVMPQTLGHFCMLASVYVLGIVLVQRYVRARDLSRQS